MSLGSLVNFLQDQNDFYIEVEGKLPQIQKKLGLNLTEKDDGVCALDKNANKWGLEYRLYTHERPTPPLGNSFHSNTEFRHTEYEYRLSDNDLVSSLLSSGFHLGRNWNLHMKLVYGIYIYYNSPILTSPARIAYPAKQQ